MNEKDYRRIIKNPRHIPGVHNYCDRWCERCPLTLRCSVFAIGQIEDTDRPPPPPDGPALWPRLESLQPFAAELLQKHADHPGIPLAKNPKFKNLNRPVDSAPIGAAAKRYMEFTHIFVKEKYDDLAKLSAPTDFPITLLEALEIINTYHMLITVKLSRALDREDDDDDNNLDDNNQPYPSDNDGSAKVVLLSLDRSILAWLALTHLLPDLTPTALAATLTLARLRTGVEKHFPKARTFKREGFDTLRFK